MPPCSKFLTGLTNLDGYEDKKIPGKNFYLISTPSDDADVSSPEPFDVYGGKNAISRVLLTEACKSSVIFCIILIALSYFTSYGAICGSTEPINFPSNTIGK
jgi:hypothetical protein